MEHDTYITLCNSALAVYRSESMQNERRLGLEKTDKILGAQTYLGVLDKLINHYKEAVNNAGD